jgi:hypothetical protein
VDAIAWGRPVRLLLGGGRRLGVVYIRARITTACSFHTKVLYTVAASLPKTAKSLERPFPNISTTPPTVKLARLTEQPVPMDPPSPSKLGMSPPWKPRVASPEHLGREVPYGEPLLQSPSMPHLGAIPPLSPTRSPTRSPIRSQHRRTDSDVSVQGLATMFEGLEVKDPREAVQRYKQLLDKEKLRFVDKLKRQEKEHTMSVERRALRIEELESELALARSQLQAGVSRAQYEKEYMDNKANVKRWEQLFKEREDQWNSDHRKLVSSTQNKTWARANAVTRRI